MEWGGSTVHIVGHVLLQQIAQLLALLTCALYMSCNCTIRLQLPACEGIFDRPIPVDSTLSLSIIPALCLAQLLLLFVTYCWLKRRHIGCYCFLVLINCNGSIPSCVKRMMNSAPLMLPLLSISKCAHNPPSSAGVNSIAIRYERQLYVTLLSLQAWHLTEWSL